MIEEPRSTLGRYVVRHWERISLVEGESLVYWLRKLVFRGAWLDHRVKEGLLEVAWDDEAADFGYRDPHGGRALLELAPVPSWHELQFRRARRDTVGGCSARERSSSPRRRARRRRRRVSGEQRPHRVRRVRPRPNGNGWGPTIVSVRPDGTGRQTLTNPTRTSGDFDPRGLPTAAASRTSIREGDRRRGTSGTEIWVMSADGSGKRRLTRNSSFDGGPTWSPDGRRILFARGPLFADGRAAPLRPLGHERRRVGPAPADAYARARARAGWSPRGDRLAFLVAPPVRVCTPNACTLGRERDVWTAAPDGTRRRPAGSGATCSRPHRRGRPTANGSPQARGSASSASRPRARTRASSAAATIPPGRPTGRRSSSPRCSAARTSSAYAPLVGGRTTPITHNPAPAAELLIDQTQPDWQPLR